MPIDDYTKEQIWDIMIEARSARNSWRDYARALEDVVRLFHDERTLKTVPPSDETKIRGILTNDLPKQDQVLTPLIGE